MLASKTRFKLSPRKKKRISCGLFYLLVRYSEVAGMLFLGSYTDIILCISIDFFFVCYVYEL